MTPIDARLLGLAAEMGVAIEYEPLDDRDGEYSHGSRLIRLRPAMHGRLWRSVLAHELGHASYGDLPTPFGPMHLRQERRAELWAALHLIDLDDYRCAEDSCEGHAGAIAVELGIMRSTVEAFQHALARLADHTYIAPRMGAGQYAARVDVQW